MGFALTLALTLRVAAIGWISLSATLERSNRLSLLADLSLATKDLRIARLRYQASNNPADRQATEQMLDNLQQHTRSLAQRLPEADSQRWIEQLQQHTRNYQGHLTELARSIDSRTAAQQGLLQQANELVQLIDRSERSIVDDLGGDSDARLAALDSLTTFERLFSGLRSDVLIYVNHSNPELKAASLAAFERLRANHAGLAAQMGRYASGMQASGQLLDNHLDNLNRYARELELSLGARQQMIDIGEQINQTSDTLVSQQIAQRDQASSQAKLWISVSLVPALLLGGLAAWLITRQITQPLRAVLQATERIANGNLASQSFRPRADEMGQLQAAIGHMTEHLRELVGRIRDSVTQIASAAEELSAVTEQTNAGVNNQRSETDQVATAINQMTATVQEVARNAEQASVAANEADQEAIQGEQVVNEAARGMGRLADEVQRSSQAMEQLKQESSKISSVLDVIKSVAEQTNLLALNAAIEAARAGDAGRGFAVVADEVRGLAQRTQKSTEEIEELIAGLHRGTQQAASRMDSSLELAGHTVELVHKANQALASINQQVHEIQGMNQQIATAAEQQSAVSEEINRSVVNVRDISEQTAAASQQTAAASTELARLGGELQQLVSGFRL